MFVGHQGFGQLLAVKVFGDERVVRHFQTVLHGQIERSGRFAAAADADQNHIALGQIGMGLAVIMRQAEVDGLDAVFVFLAFGQIGKAPDAVVAFDVQLDFQRLHKGAEHVQHHGAAFGFDEPENVVVYQRGKNDGALAFGIGCLVDLLHGLARFIHVRHKRQAHMAQRLLKFELVEDGVAEGFGRDAGAVRNKKYGALVGVLLCHGVSGLTGKMGAV